MVLEIHACVCVCVCIHIRGYTHIHISKNLSSVPSETQSATFASLFAIYLVTASFSSGRTCVVPAESTVLPALPGGMDFVYIASNREGRRTGSW